LYLGSLCTLLCCILTVFVHCWVVSWLFFLYLVGLCLGSLCTLFCFILAVCLCTLLCCILEVFVHIVGFYLCSFFVYIVGFYLCSLSIYAQLRRQCCKVVLRNVTACLGLHKNMFQVSAFLPLSLHYDLYFVLFIYVH
jgi:hypothetical protein